MDCPDVEHGARRHICPPCGAAAAACLQCDPQHGHSWRRRALLRCRPLGGRQRRGGAARQHPPACRQHLRRQQRCDFRAWRHRGDGRGVEVAVAQSGAPPPEPPTRTVDATPRPRRRHSRGTCCTPPPSTRPTGTRPTCCRVGGVLGVREAPPPPPPPLLPPLLLAATLAQPRAACCRPCPLCRPVQRHLARQLHRRSPPG